MESGYESLSDVQSTSSEYIRAIRTRPDRVVFITDGSPDAWIASDVLTDLSP